MALFTLTFDVLGSFGSEAPNTIVYYGGVKVEQFYASTSLSSYSVELDTDNFDHSQLYLRFLNSGSEVGRSVEFSNIALNGVTLDLSGFSTSGGATVATNSVVLDVGENAGYDASTDLGLAPPITYGTSGGDKLYADDFGNEIDGLEGNDTIYGKNGNDTIHGGEGNDALGGRGGDDTINGDLGDDTLWGGAGNDILNGGEGNDRLIGDNGDDVLSGGLGNDLLYGGVGDDQLFGGDGDDFLRATDGSNELHGEAGNDKISGGNGNDLIFGGDGHDYIHGWNGDDEIHGGIGKDSISGDAGNDLIFGDDGDDVIYGGAGDDTLNGGEGNDSFNGSIGNDIINGDAGSDILNGGDGADTLDGGADNDFLYGGDGGDIINGGAGNDMVYAYNSILPVGETFQDKILNDAPVAYFQLNELNGTTASNSGSGASLDSIYSNGVSLGNAALFSGGYTSADFDGVNDFINVPNSALINLTDITQRTIELVFNADTTAGRQVLFEEGGGTNAMVIYIDDGDLYFNVRDGSGTTWGPFTINAAINAGETYHAALVMDTAAGYVQGYVNGALIGSGSALTTLSSHSGQIGIGGVNNATYFHDGAFSGNGHYFDGKISDVAIHNTVIDPATLAERFALMQSGGSTNSFNDGDDQLFGGDGDDQLFTSAGDDDADGGNGNDLIYGGIGSNNLVGGAGNDIIYADGQQITALGGSATVGLQTQILAGSPVAYWQFDETSGSVATNLGVLGSVANGTIENGVTLDVGGIYANDDSAMNFDGVNDRIQVADSAQINTGTVAERTIEVIFNADTTTGRQVIFEEGGTINAIAIYIEDGDLYINARDGNGAIWGPFTINAAIDAGTTYHAAFVLDSGAGEVRGYLDGVLMGTGIVDGPLNAHSGDIGIGFSDGGAYYHDGADATTGYYFDGTISDLAIYNSVLSQAELQSHVNLMDGSFTYTAPFDDTLSGGDGFDQLYAGAGRDLLVFEGANAFNDVDQINDYSLGDGDTFDISDLLSGFAGGSSNINDFVRFVNSGSDNILQVDANGAVGGVNFQDVAQVNGLNDLDAANLYGAGAIIA